MSQTVEVDRGVGSLSPAEVLALHVIDRHGQVWRIVRDGGMATRADDVGIVSVGIQFLERTAGPLQPVGSADDALLADVLRDALGPERPYIWGGDGDTKWGLDLDACVTITAEQAAAIERISS